MKKLLPVFVVACIVTFNVFAGNIFDYVPAGSSAVGRVDMAVLLNCPEVKKALGDPESLAKQAEFAAKTGCNIRDISDVVICVGQKSDAVMLVQLTKAIDVASALEKYGSKAAVIPAGRFRVLKIDSKAAVCQLDSKTAAFGSSKDLVEFCKSVFGIPAELKAQISAFKNNKNTLCWLAFSEPQSGMGCVLSLGFSGKDNRDYDFNAVFSFADEQTAAQFASVTPMYAGMFSGMIFSAKPELGAEILKQLKITPAGNTIRLNLAVSAELADKIATYAKSSDVKKMLNNNAGKSAKK